MNIREVIAKLESLAKEHGEDLDVCTYDGEYGSEHDPVFELAYTKRTWPEPIKNSEQVPTWMLRQSRHVTVRVAPQPGFKKTIHL